MASVAFPAYALGLDPARRIICVSYSADLAKKLSNDHRAVVESEWYRQRPFKVRRTEQPYSCGRFVHKSRLCNKIRELIRLRFFVA
jgi:hypothetical protein